MIIYINNRKIQSMNSVSSKKNKIIINNTKPFHRPTNVMCSIYGTKSAGETSFYNRINSQIHHITKIIPDNMCLCLRKDHKIIPDNIDIIECFIILVDITNDSALQNTDNIAEQIIKEHKGDLGEDYIICIVINKIDVFPNELNIIDNSCINYCVRNLKFCQKIPENCLMIQECCSLIINDEDDDHDYYHYQPYKVLQNIIYKTQRMQDNKIRLSSSNNSNDSNMHNINSNSNNKIDKLSKVNKTRFFSASESNESNESDESSETIGDSNLSIDDINELWDFKAISKKNKDIIDILEKPHLLTSESMKKYDIIMECIMIAKKISTHRHDGFVNIEIIEILKHYTKEIIANLTEYGWKCEIIPSKYPDNLNMPDTLKISWI